MGYRIDKFAPGEIYHIFTRGVEKRVIFHSDADKNRFLDLLTHCLPIDPIQSYSVAKRSGKQPTVVQENQGLVNLLCYCLMPNHFHLLVRENVVKGITLYMQRLLTSYSRYFNVRNHRSGSLFLHPFKAVLINNNDQLIHVSRYIHLNPYVAHLINNQFNYRWSSLGEYMRMARKTFCHQSLIREMLSTADHRAFISDHADYARSIANLDHLLIDNNP